MIANSPLTLSIYYPKSQMICEWKIGSRSTSNFDTTTRLNKVWLYLPGRAQTSCHVLVGNSLSPAFAAKGLLQPDNPKL